jgi:hypothetical protein
VKLRVTVAEDAALGVRDFRIATPQGVSSIGQIVLVDGAVARAEDLKPKQGEDGQPLPGLLVTVPPAASSLHVTGRIEKNEDIDTYRFTAEAGDQITFAVLCQRLQDKIHDLQKHADPILFLKDAAGRELASNNNYFFADPLLHYRFEKAGEYLLELRDVRYAGDKRWAYVLSVTRGPFVLNVFPFAGRAGEKLHVTPAGFNVGADAELTIPPNWSAGPHPVRLEFGPAAANPVPLLVSDLPQVTEEADAPAPDPAQQQAGDAPLAAQPIDLPIGVNGRLLAEGDVDAFSFQAEKGKRYTFEIVARRLMNDFGWYASELDSYLAVVNAKGRELASNDDATGKDSRIDWTAPADGTFAVVVRDLNYRGGPDFVYHLTAGPARPDFTLRCDGDKAMIGPGSHTMWSVQVERRNGFDGPVQLRVEGLPEGVTATCATIEPHMTQGAIILSAEWDAPLGTSNVRVVGTGTVTGADGTPAEITTVATPLEEIYNPGGGRRIYGVALHTVSVTDRSDLVQLIPSRLSVSLKPGESVRIDLNVNRRPDYTGAVTIDLKLQHLGRVYGDPLPPGVTIDESASKLRLAPGDAANPTGETRAHVVLKAAPDAKPVNDLPIAVMGYVSINFVVKVGYSTPPIFLSVGAK